MSSGVSSDLANHARQAFVEQIVREGPKLLASILEAVQVALDEPAERARVQRRQKHLEKLRSHRQDWLRLQTECFLEAEHLAEDSSFSVSDADDAPVPGPQETQPLTLVDEETMQREVLCSHLTQALIDAAFWEFNDLSARVCSLERRGELRDSDIFRPQMLARQWTNSFWKARMGADLWAGLENILKSEISLVAAAAYHEANRWFIEQGVMPDVVLRPFVRHPRTVRPGQAAPGEGGSSHGSQDAPQGFGRTSGFAGSIGASQDVLQRFGRTMERHVAGFMDTMRHQPPSSSLMGAVIEAQNQVAHRLTALVEQEVPPSPAVLVDELRDQKRVLKESAHSPAERATIEVVALLFQNILMEDRLPASVRVWFARLQMPALRVAIGEPDFFSSVTHPARQLIDRMGACVMGFDAAPVGVGEKLEAEIRRIVQVVEAFPETGRKVFQTVLNEFERFLERYFRDQNETTRKGVSLAQQVEQRETLAIQFTIELRKLLDGVPVQEGVRDFLFQVWADVLATTAVRHGPQSPQAQSLKDTALELVWIASAKTTRGERAEVIRRLGPLLAALRQGMQSGGMNVERQDTALRALNQALTAAFGARAAAIDPEQLSRLKHRLQALDDVLPDADFEIDDSFALDLSGHESDDLEVVVDGGVSSHPEALAAVDALPVGAWYMLEYRDRNEAVQLAWQGMRRQLSLFVSASGRGVLFQKQRLAAFLEAGLLVPARDESLTTVATRQAMEKINADPSRLK